MSRPRIYRSSLAKRCNTIAGWVQPGANLDFFSYFLNWQSNLYTMSFLELTVHYSTPASNSCQGAMTWTPGSDCSGFCTAEQTVTDSGHAPLVGGSGCSNGITPSILRICSVYPIQSRLHLTNTSLSLHCIQHISTVMHLVNIHWTVPFIVWT